MLEIIRLNVMDVPHVCEYICPKKAISLTSDEKGVLYPEVDNALCINCGLCLNTCPIGKEATVKNSRAEKCFAVPETTR